MAIFSVSGILILMNFIVSYRGFKDRVFYEKYSFQIDRVLIHKDYKVIVTSGFLHVSWTHLIFNMFSLYIFSNNLERSIGPVNYLIIYAAGLVGGNLLSLFIHRYHSDYSAAGASGAIFAIMFSAIAIFPDMRIGFFFLPSMPGWLFGLLYVVVSIYGIRSRTSNIGHDAHLGGGIAGMVVAILLFPSIIVTNSLTLLIVALPALAFILFIVYKPHALFIDNNFFKTHRYLNVEDRYNLSKQNRQKDLDKLLEKVHAAGINSLTRKEREMLKEYSK